MVKYLAFYPPAQATSVIGVLSSDGKTVTALTHPTTGAPVYDFFDVVEQWSLFERAAAAQQKANGHANGNGIAAASPTTYALDAVTFAAPLLGRDVMAVGKNYAEHAKEFNKSGYDSSDKNDMPDYPVIFTKRASSIVAHQSEIYPHPQATDTLDYEGELGIIIGKAGFNVSMDDAMQHVWGYTIINDVTARERQRDHKQFFIGKSLDTFCPIGPYLVPASDIDGANLDLETKVNGQTRQKANTRDLIFDIPTLIHTISLGITLQPGDVIASGTPAGVGFGLTPPQFLQVGDLVEVSIGGIGVLQNRVADPSKRGPAAVAPVRVTGAPGPVADKGLVRLANGKLYHVEQRGQQDGPVLVLVHGLGGNIHFYDAIVQQADLASKYRIVALDWDGHGITPLSGQTQLSVDALADDVSLVLSAIGVPQQAQVSVLGHSLGGLIATTWAAKNAARLAKLALIGPVKAFNDQIRGALQARAQAVRQDGMLAVVDAICKGGLSQATQAKNPLAVSFVRQSLMATNAEGYARACQAASHGSDPNYAAIAAPTLIVSGDEDKTAPAATITSLSELIKDAKVHQLNGVGHWHAVEDVTGVASALSSFL